MPFPLTSGPLPLDQSRSVATKRRPRCGTACTTTRPAVQSASRAGAASAGGSSASRPTGRRASALCTRTSAKPIPADDPGRRRCRSAATRSRSASSGTGASLRRFAALLIDRSGRNPPRMRSSAIDRYVLSAFCTRWERTSRIRHPSHHDGEFHAASSSDTTRSANWRRRRATSSAISGASTIHSLTKIRRDAVAFDLPCGRGDATSLRRELPRPKPSRIGAACSGAPFLELIR
jgi:hypothetical protein